MQKCLASSLSIQIRDDVWLGGLTLPNSDSLIDFAIYIILGAVVGSVIYFPTTYDYQMYYYLLLHANALDRRPYLNCFNLVLESFEHSLSDDRLYVVARLLTFNNMHTPEY